MWSLGIVLYAMCFSTLPFLHNDPHVLKGLIRRFVEERQILPESLAAGDTSEDAAAWLPQDVGGRVGPLRMVTAALLAFDVDRRPAATDLLENPVFRAQAVRHARRIGDCAALHDN